MASKSNYLNGDEVCEELGIDLACVRRFVRWNWLAALKTTTGILIHRYSVNRLRTEHPRRLAYAQLHCRKVAERRRLKASQQTLEL